MEIRPPAACSAPVKSDEVNWLPRSVLKISGGPNRTKASSSASTQDPTSIVFDTRRGLWGRKDGETGGLTTTRTKLNRAAKLSKEAGPPHYSSFSGGPGGTRTPNQPGRNRLLYPVELRVHPELQSYTRLAQQSWSM